MKTSARCALLALLTPFVASSGCGKRTCQDFDGTWAPVVVGDVAEVQLLLVGRWQKCGGGEPVNLQSPFEFTDAGRWQLLGGPRAGTYEITALDSLTIFYDDFPGSPLTSNLSFEREPLLMLYGPAFYSPLP